MWPVLSRLSSVCTWNRLHRYFLLPSRPDCRRHNCSKRRTEKKTTESVEESWKREEDYCFVLLMKYDNRRLFQSLRFSNFKRFRFIFWHHIWKHQWRWRTLHLQPCGLSTAKLLLCLLWCSWWTSGSLQIDDDSNFGLILSKASQAPMFVSLTFDDALNVVLFPLIKRFFDVSHAVDAAGCKPNGVYFLQNLYTDYHLMQQLKANYSFEVALHTIDHSTGVGTDIDTWYRQMNYSRAYTSQLTQTPISQIWGWRFPYLQHTNEGLQLLSSLGYTYDSSISDQYELGDTELLWPYTFDYGSPVSTSSSLRFWLFITSSWFRLTPR